MSSHDCPELPCPTCHPAPACACGVWQACDVCVQAVRDRPPVSASGSFGGWTWSAGEFVAAVYFGSANLTATGVPEYANAADLHITLAGGHCGKTDCTRCDPLDRYVDGLTVRQCLETFEQFQREDRFLQFLGPGRLTTNQLIAAKQAWSAQLRTKLQQTEEKRRAEICVDDDRWEP